MQWEMNAQMKGVLTRRKSFASAYIMAHYVCKDALSSPQMQHYYTITKVLPVLLYETPKNQYKRITEIYHPVTCADDLLKSNATTWLSMAFIIAFL